MWLSPEWLVTRGPSVWRRAPSNTDGSTAVKHYAAIDVSLELSSVCVVDASGKVVKESKVETHPDALVKFFKDLGLPLTLIGLEAGPLSQWLHAGGRRDLKRSSWRRGMSRRRCPPRPSRPIAGTHAAWLSCCAWGGSDRF